MKCSAITRRGVGGFTLVELLVVVGIIALTAAASLPAMMRYLRNYRIRGAAQQVAGEIQAARQKAIAKNVNLGVVFVVLSPTTYRFVIEDNQAGGSSLVRPEVSALLPVQIQTGPERVLPVAVRFATTCPGFPTVGLESGFRFNRFGAWCNPDSGSAECPDLDTGANLAANGAGGTVLCVEDVSNVLTRTIEVTPGGRVLAQP